jgi:nucleotide-binding universal stress UspA family protein
MSKLEIKLILCPIDFSESSVRAYRHALSVAVHYQAKVVALHVVDLALHPSLGFAATAGLYEEFCRALCDNGEEQLQKFVKRHANSEIQPDLSVEMGNVPDTILSFAQAQYADVIVMGTHGQRGYDRLMLGSVADRVMRTSPRNVLVVCKPPHESTAVDERGHRVHHLSRILLCTDFSENSERALKHAISLTSEYDAELTLLHVLEKVPRPARAAGAKAAATEQLEKLIPAKERKTLKIATAVRIGKAYEQIIQFALETEIDLAMMGVRGRNALDLAIFGSTTHRVMQLGPCPVLVAHV